MHTGENTDSKPWSFWSFIVLSLCLTIFTLLFAVYKLVRRPVRSELIETPNDLASSKINNELGHRKQGVMKQFHELKYIRLARVKVGENPNKRV